MDENGKVIVSFTQRPKPLNVDDILRIIGEFGRFHWILEMVSALMFIVPAIHIYIMIFAAPEPDWKCVEGSLTCYLNGTQPSTNEYRCSIPRSEWEFVQDEGTRTVIVDFDIYCESSWLIYMTSSIFYLGKLVGAFVFGWMADTYGRKRILFPTLALALLTELAAIVTPNLWLFLMFRFFCGMFIAGLFNTLLLMVSEFVSTRYRPLATSILWMFWIVGLCLLPLQAYFIRDWKILFLVCSAPYLLSLLSFWFIPESPRWLRTEERMDEAIKVLKEIARWNGKEIDEKTTLSKPVKINEQRTTPLALFKKDMIKSTLAQGVLWSTTGLVYIGLASTAGDLGGSVYLNFVYLSLAEIPSNVLAAHLPNRFGRKKTTILSLFLAGIFCISIGFIPINEYGKIIRVVFGMIGKFLSTLSLNTVTIWSFELFPTSIRSKGLSWVYMALNVGTTASPWIVQGLKVYSNRLPFFTMGGSALLGSFAGFVLEETNGKDAKDTRDEVYHEKDGDIVTVVKKTTCL